MIRFRVATLNLDGNENNFPNRIYDLSDNIVKFKFDLICLQEDFISKNFSSSSFLNLELDYHCFDTRLSESKNITILSKYKIDKIDEIYFDKNENKKIACQLGSISFNNYKLLIANMSLGDLNINQRVGFVSQVLNKINELNLYDLVIFSISLNSNPFFPEIKKIENEGFTSINKKNTHKNKIVLDYIFYKTSLSLETNSDIVFENYSNHHILTNNFKLK